MKITSSRPRRGFTLVELLAVITIIIILASVVIGGMGLVKERQARSTAKIQLGLITNALEEYKLDNGSYPMGDAGAKGESNILFRALYWGIPKTMKKVARMVARRSIFRISIQRTTSKGGSMTLALIRRSSILGVMNIITGREPLRTANRILMRGTPISTCGLPEKMEKPVKLTRITRTTRTTSRINSERTL